MSVGRPALPSEMLALLVMGAGTVAAHHIFVLHVHIVLPMEILLNELLLTGMTDSNHRP